MKEVNYSSFQCEVYADNGRDPSTRKVNMSKKEWIYHDLVLGITSIIKYVKRKTNGNYIVAVARGYRSPSEPTFSKKFGRNAARDRMHRYYKAYNFTKNRRNKPFVVKAEPHAKPEKGIHQDKIVFFVGPESMMTLDELSFWHSRILPCVEASE